MPCSMSAAEEMTRLLQQKDELIHDMTMRVDKSNQRVCELSDTLKREQLTSAMAGYPVGTHRYRYTTM